MALQSFAELLHRLKEVHEQEVEGWQEKVLELTNKKNCDTKRLEELYSRNQQMREQQRMLTENIKQLENMLRAGLCDRCTVTQEVAKKRQQDFESSQLQSLQHISLLMSEISALMKENEKLKEEVKSLRGRIDQHNGHREKARSPDVKRSPDPAPLTVVASALKPEQSPTGGATPSTATVKSESEHSSTIETLSDRKESADKGSEHKELQGWSGTYPYESSKLSNLVSAANSGTWRQRRAASVDSFEHHLSPISASLSSLPSQLRLLKKSSYLSEERHDRVSMPLRPHPIKTAPLTLHWPLQEQSDWVGMAAVGSGGHSNLNQDSTVLRISSLGSPTGGLEHHSPSQGSSHPRSWSDQPGPPRRSLSDLAENRGKRPTVSVITLPGWKGSAAQPGRIFGENLREVEEESPLDLSSVGGSKVKETERLETVQSKPQSSLASSSSSSSSPSPPAPLSSPSSAQYVSSPQSDPQTEDTKPKREESWERSKEADDEEKTEVIEISENLKVPTLTISLRPVVILESLKSAKQNEQNMVQSSSQPEQEEEEENNQNTVRKRAGQDSEALQQRALKEKRMRLTVMSHGSNHSDSEQG